MSKTPLILLLLLQLLLLLGSDASNAGQTINARCQDSCGGMPIPYPFGIGGGCFRPGFEMTCDGDQPFLVGGMKPTRVSRLFVETAEARVMLPIGWQCFNSSKEVNNSNTGDVEFNRDGVYRISYTHNHFVVLGCNTFGYTGSHRNQGVDDYDYSEGYYTGCLCYCNDTANVVSGACSGVGCCNIDIAPGLSDNTVSFDENYTRMISLDFSPCDYAFLVEKESYTFSTADLRMDVHRTMPVRLDWAIRDNPTCGEAKKNETQGGFACVSDNSDCLNSTNGPGYVCNCSMGYEGNPYVANGCKGKLYAMSMSVNVQTNTLAMASAGTIWVPTNASAPRVPTVLIPSKIPATQNFLSQHRL
ncbi:hypothetical protein ABZP36_029060 [Zizania latifolia]